MFEALFTDHTSTVVRCWLVHARSCRRRWQRARSSKWLRDFVTAEIDDEPPPDDRGEGIELKPAPESSAMVAIEIRYDDSYSNFCSSQRW